MRRGTLTGALAGVLVLTGGLTGGMGGAALAERLALVVGNGDYAALPPIGTAPRDAADLARALERLDFKVTLLTDATGLGLVGALRDLIGQADQGGADTLLFYYAGHGFQLDGTNYLVPVDATLAGRGRIAAETLPLDGVLARLGGRNRQVILLLDASAAAVLPPEISGADTPVGLAPITPGNGTFVAFSAQPDTLGVTAGAAEGAAPHSPFAAALLDKIEEKGVSVSDTMIRVRSAVEKATERRQTPWDRSSLRAQFYFNPVYETSSGLTAADYEMLAGMAPERRAQFLKLLDNTGISFKIQNIEEAKADIVAAGQLTITAAPEAGQVAPADTGPAGPSFQILAEAPPEAAPETRPEVVAETAPAPAAPGPAASVTPPMITAPSVTAPTGPDVIALATPDLPARPGQAGSPRMIAPEPAQTAPVADTTPDQAPALDDTVTASIPPATPPAATVVATAPSDTAPAPEAAPEPAPEVAAPAPEPAPEPAEPETPALMLALADPRAPAPGDAATATDAPAMTDAVTDAVTDLVIPADLASAVQTELSRVGCYRARVDGAWGRQSSLAAIRYYSERDVTPDTLEPTEALYRLLVAEDSVVCKNTVAVARAVVRPEATAPAPVVRQTPRRVIEAPAQNETRRRTIGGGITGVFR